MQDLYIYNTKTRKKEKFKPISPPRVGLYVCGPTVYGDAHLGQARSSITFDLLFRYLKHIGYIVRYVRNITDVGHLESDADEGEDKIAKRARIEKLEPMEVVQYYTNRYHQNMRQLNVLEPGIEPHASGHIIEQQEFVKKILENGYAYEINGSVYFDVEKYNKNYQYGKLSGRVLEDLKSDTRQLDGQSEKKNPFDFALWKKASPGHIMQWKSDWSSGFPGWHLECSVMSTKYLGEQFDIHGGGIDLLFPHHECEIAQSTAALGKESVRYWMHNNLITLNGQKMGKSLGNAISLDELFSGEHKMLEKPYHPMTIRFFILQAHYRSTLDFSNEALQAAEKGLERLFNGMKSLEKIKPSAKSTFDVAGLRKKCYKAMNDDLNSAMVIAHLSDGIRLINSIESGTGSISNNDLNELKDLYQSFVFDIFGLDTSRKVKSKEELSSKLIDMILNFRLEAQKNKDFQTSDNIRKTLNELGVEIKDKKDGFEWKIR
ncbi:MAG: cysteine--tRNA ligase [Bacteroidales bacterium]|nr:cysteine--tRNA ligase [Bacteroidales bacterium]